MPKSLLAELPDGAEVLRAQGRRHRFHGSTPPDTTKPRAELVTGEPVDGVATIRLYDVIDSFGGYWGISAREVAAALDDLGSEVTEIRLHINSPGGEVFEGIAIMNLLRSHPARVVAVVDGLAASAASFVATSADEVVMGRNTQLMIHDAWGLCIGAAVDMRETGDLLDRLSDNIAAVYADKAGGVLGTWRAAMLAETWYSAQEAVDAGLADSVEGGAAEEDQSAAAKYDLKDLGYKYAGRAQSPAPTTAPADMPPAPAHTAGAGAAAISEATRARKQALLTKQSAAA